MTEREWLESADVQQMLNFVRTKTTQRKKRLFCCACCRLIWEDILNEASRRAVAASERYADGLLPIKELHPIRGEAIRVAADRQNLAVANRWRTDLTVTSRAANAAAESATIEVNARVVAGQVSEVVTTTGRSAALVADVLREVVGNPFRLIEVDRRFRTRTVLALAERASDANFAILPVLADALEETGFSEPSLLAHLRDPGPHHRGCWAVDAVLGLL